jgi:hypothetical protein
MDRLENNIYNLLTVSTRNIPLWLLRVWSVSMPYGMFTRNMAYIQHLAISLTLLQDCQNSLFAEVLPRLCPRSPSKHWYCCLWEVMALVWLSSVHVRFLNSITNLFAMSVSFHKPHAQKSQSREVYDIGWHYCSVQQHTEVMDHNRQRWSGTSDLNSNTLSHFVMQPGNSDGINHKSITTSHNTSYNHYCNMCSTTLLILMDFCKC